MERIAEMTKQGKLKKKERQRLWERVLKLCHN